MSKPLELNKTNRITLINVFELPKEASDRFLHKWKLDQEILLQHPGFINGTLHHSIHEEARFRFINVAHWETEAHLKAGTDAIHAAEAAGTVPLWDTDIHINPATFTEQLHY